MVETQQPNFKGTIQSTTIKDDGTKEFKTVGQIKLYIRVPKEGEGENLPSMKGYLGINDKEFYEISLWETT